MDDEEAKKLFMEQIERFYATFQPLTNALNPNDITLPMRGFNIFAWMPMLWPTIYNFPIQPEDIIIATFPKAGTTWLQQMVYLIVTEDFEGANTVPLFVRSPFIEFPIPPTPATLEEYAQRPGPRIMKTHLPTCLLPKNASKARMIYVYRNPKDSAVSFFHHYRLMHPEGAPFPWTFDEYAKKFMKGDVAFGPLPEHLQGYLEYQKAGNSILMLRYEDMKKDTRQVIRQVAEYLGKKLSDKTVEKIFEATKVGSMRANQTVNFERKVGGEVQNFVRKGTVGDWKNHFEDPKLIEAFDEFFEKNVPNGMLYKE